jgi:hypothetical protein
MEQLTLKNFNFNSGKYYAMNMNLATPHLWNQTNPISLRLKQFDCIGPYALKKTATQYSCLSMVLSVISYIL